MKVMLHQYSKTGKKGRWRLQHVTKDILCLRLERHEDANCRLAFAFTPAFACPWLLAWPGL